MESRDITRPLQRGLSHVYVYVSFLSLRFFDRLVFVLFVVVVVVVVVAAAAAAVFVIVVVVVAVVGCLVQR